MKAHLLSTKRVQQIIAGSEYGWHHDGERTLFDRIGSFKTFSWTTRIYRSGDQQARDYGHGQYALFTLHGEARAESKRVRQIAAMAPGQSSSAWQARGRTSRSS